MELTIEKLIYGGEGLGRVEGQVVFAPFVLPGERVSAEGVESKSGLARARSVEVIAASPDRVLPLCPYFHRCGGCHYQHASYPAQLVVKRDILTETLRRIGKFEPPSAIEVVSDEPWGYRNRVQLHLAGREIGYRLAKSHRLCAIDQCPISAPSINSAIARLRAMLHDRRWPRFLRSVELFTNGAETQLNTVESDRPVARRFFEWCDAEIPGAGQPALDYRAAGFDFRVGARSFFQVNRFLVDALATEALWQAEGDEALDLFAGVGLFSLPLAQRLRRVVAVETGVAAARDLQFNALRAGLPVDSVREDAGAYLGSLETRPDFVLADPPRAGLNRHAVERLAVLVPPRLTIVSCDPATLARDLAGLLKSGYEIARLAMIDLFPQTYHVETVAHLRRGP